MPYCHVLPLRSSKYRPYCQVLPLGSSKYRPYCQVPPLSTSKYERVTGSPTPPESKKHVRFLHPRVYPVVGAYRIRPPIATDGGEYTSVFCSPHVSPVVGRNSIRPPDATSGGEYTSRVRPLRGCWLGVFDTPLHRVHDWIRKTHTFRRRVRPRGRPDCAIFAIRDRGGLCEQDYSSNSRPPAPPLTKSNDDRPA